MIPSCSHGQHAIVLARLGTDRTYKQLTHYWTASLQDALNTYDTWLRQQNNAGFDVFYTTGAFAPVTAALDTYTGRQGSNCVAQRSLFLDIDAKDQLIPTVDACEHALVRFVQDSGIAAPSSVVHSGNGLHCYWLCNEDIDLVLWKAMADTLAAAAHHFGLKADVKCTIDRTRILRVPGFVNHKHGTVVEVVWPDAGAPVKVHTVEELAQMLTPHFGLAPATPARHTGGGNDLATMFPGVDLSAAMDKSVQGDSFGVETASWTKLRDASLRGDGCTLLAQAMLNQGSVRYDLWTGILSVAAHTDSPDQAFVDTCGQHPEFDLGACQRKAASFDGPRRCETLQAAAVAQGMPNPCAGCRFAGKIGSPVVLGKPDFALRGETQVVQERVVVQESRPDGTVANVVQTVAVEKRALPFPYCRVPGKPGVYVKRRQEGPNGVEWVTDDMPLMDEDISVTMVRTGVDGVVAAFEYVHPVQGTQKFSIPMASFGAKQGESWTTALSNHFVKISRAAVNPIWRAEVSKFLQDIVTDYTDNIKAADTVSQFGPIDGQHQATFVLGNVNYIEGKAPEQVVLADAISRHQSKIAALPGTPAERLREQETLAHWNAGLSAIMGSPEFAVDQFVLMTGLACPMAAHVVPSRQRGGLIAVHSGEAGAGKTSLVSRAINMYVSGENALVEPNTTVMAFLEKTLAPAGALPVLWDEAGKGSREKAAANMQMLALSSTDRKPRMRLTGPQTDVSWQSWFYSTANQDTHELLSYVSEAETGAAARVLSVKVDRARFGSGETMLARQTAALRFDDWAGVNANVVGRRWVEHFMQRLPHLRERYGYWQARLAKDCPTTFEDGAMRFVVAIVASTMAAAEEAGAIGLHPFNVEGIYAYATTLLEVSSESTKNAVTKDEDLLDELLRSSVDVTLIRHTSGVSVNDRVPTREVAIRMEVGSGTSEIFIAPNYMKAWCKQRGLSFNTLRAQLDAAGAQRVHKRMTAGTALPDSRIYAYSFKQYSTETVKEKTT